MAPLSSYTATLPANVLLETGILYFGSSIFSAQDGGLKFDPKKTIREVMFVGKRSRVKGLDRTVDFKPTISGTVLEFSAANIPVFEPGAVATTQSGGPTGFTTGYKPKQGGVLYASGDYITTCRVVYQRGDGTFCQVRFYDGGVVAKWDLTGTDKQEGKVAIEVEAVLDMTVSGRNTNDAPYVIEYMSSAPA